MFRSLRVFLLAAAAAAEGVWGPADSVHALDGVIGAMDKMLKLPHLSSSQMDDAKRIAADIKADVEAVESGKLSKQQAHEKVGSSLKELAAFEAELAKSSTSREDRIASIKKQIKEKQAALEKAEKMMHLLKLQKELVEKKLMLEKLIAAKAKAGSKQQSDAEDIAKFGALVKELKDVAGNMNSTSTKKAIAAVHAREEAVSSGLARMEASEKQSEAMMETALKGQLGAAKGDALIKGKAMLKELTKREHRKFAKARAQKELELSGLKEVEGELTKGDAAALQKSLAKLEQQGKAKSGKFLY